MAQATFPLAIVIRAIDRASGPLTAIAGRVDRFGAGMVNVGRDLTIGLTAPVLAAGTLAANTALKAERAMQRLRDVTGLSVDQLRQADELGRSLQGNFGPGAHLEALTVLARMGASLEQSMAALPVIANLATAAEVEFAEAAKAAARVSRAYERDLKNLAQITDTLAVAAARSDEGLAGVSEGLVELSPLARDLGVDLEDLLAAFRLIGRAGQEPVTTLRSALQTLIAPTKGSAEALARLKIKPADLFESAGGLRSLGDVLGVLEARGADASDMIAVFGRRAGPGMTALLQAGRAGLVESRAALEQTGAAAEMAGRRHSSAQGAVHRFQNSIENLALKIGQDGGLLADLSALADRMSGVIERAAAADPELARTAVRIGAVAAAVGPAIWVLGKLSTVLTVATGGWKKLAVAAAAAWKVLAGSSAATALGGALGVSGGAAVGVAAAPFAALALNDQLNAFMETQSWANRLQSFSDRVVSSRAFRAGEFLLTGGGAVDWITPDSPGLGPSRGPLELRRAAAARQSAVPPTADVVVRFLNAPHGMRATVQRQRGVDVGLDVGFAMSGD